MAQWLSGLAALEGDWDLIFQHPRGGSESVSRETGNLSGFHAAHIHTCRQSTVLHTESSFLK